MNGDVMGAGLTVAVVGLNFGEAWVPIYQAHPDVADVVLCDPVAEVRERVGEATGATRRLASLDEVLGDPRVDAVHLLTPLDLHAPQSVATMAAGKHCAVAVTAALDMAALHEIVRLQDETGRNYMMMETAAYSDPVLHLRAMVESGDFGDVTFGRGEHHQEMDGWPGYWVGLPPMWYSTHALGPLLAILATRAMTVRCLGSGRLPGEKVARWGNPFPVESAIFELEDSPVSLEVTRSLFQTAHPPTESFSIYGGRHGFDWSRRSGEDMLFHSWGERGPDGRGRNVVSEPFVAPDFAHRLPLEMRGFEGWLRPLARLVDEFIRSIVEGRRPAIDAVVSADWTAAGLAAHESAMSGGAVVEIPRFGTAPGR